MQTREEIKPAALHEERGEAGRVCVPLGVLVVDDEQCELELLPTRLGVRGPRPRHTRHRHQAGAREGVGEQRSGQCIYTSWQCVYKPPCRDYRAGGCCACEVGGVPVPPRPTALPHGGEAGGAAHEAGAHRQAHHVYEISRTGKLKGQGWGDRGGAERMADCLSTPLGTEGTMLTKFTNNLPSAPRPSLLDTMHCAACVRELVCARAFAGPLEVTGSCLRRKGSSVARPRCNVQCAHPNCVMAALRLSIMCGLSCAMSISSGIVSSATPSHHTTPWSAPSYSLQAAPWARLNPFHPHHESVDRQVEWCGHLGT